MRLGIATLVLLSNLSGIGCGDDAAKGSGDWSMKGPAVASSDHPDPKDFGVDIPITVEKLYEATGYPPRMADKKLEAGMLEAASEWWRPDRNYFAVSVQARDWKIDRRRGEPSARWLWGVYYWLDKNGLCHANGHAFKQRYDGKEYSDIFVFRSHEFFESPTEKRLFSNPLKLHPAGSSAAAASIFRGQGALIEECSDPVAYAAKLADAAKKKAERDEKRKNKKSSPPKKKKR